MAGWAEAPCIFCYIEAILHVPWVLLDEQGLSPVGQSLLLRPLADRSASLRGSTFVQGLLCEKLCVFLGGVGIGMGKEGMCHCEQDVASVLRELWLVRETDTHAKDKAGKGMQRECRKCCISHEGQLGIGGCLLECKNISSTLLSHPQRLV